jgi:TRAP-type C4-dicarboxylate transport system substrate-binding protein
MGRKVVVLACAVFLVFSVCSICGAAEAPIRLKFANYFPSTHRLSTLFAEFSQEINKRSDGKVEISYYPGGTLLTAPKMAAGVLTGIADIGLSHFAYSRGRFPVMEAVELPLGFPSAWVGAGVANEFYDKFKPKEWDQFRPLAFCPSTPNVIGTLTKPVRTLEDLKGLKVRGTGRIGDIVKALGAIPMPLEMVDLYEALRRGVVDGNLGSAEQLEGFKIGELIKYVTASWRTGGCFGFYVAMSKHKWDALPPDMQELFAKVSNEYKDKWGIAFNGIDIKGIQFFKDHGGQVITLSGAETAKWVKAVEPLIANYEKDLVSKGYKEQEVDGWISFIKERTEYWKAQERARKIPSAYEY